MKTTEDGMLDLSSPDIDREPNYGRPGRKVAAVLFHERSTTSTGKRKITAHLAVVRDLVRTDPKLDPPSDVGMTWRCDLWLTDAGLRQVGLFLRAHGATGAVPIGPVTGEDDDPARADASDAALAALWAGAYVQVEMSEREGTDGRTYREFDARTASPYKGEVDPTWKDIANEAAEALHRRIEERAERERSGYGRGGGRDGGRGGGRGRGGRRGSDDDVPF